MSEKRGIFEPYPFEAEPTEQVPPATFGRLPPELRRAFEDA